MSWRHVLKNKYVKHKLLKVSPMSCVIFISQDKFSHTMERIPLHFVSGILLFLYIMIHKSDHRWRTESRQTISALHSCLAFSSSWQTEVVPTLLSLYWSDPSCHLSARYQLTWTDLLKGWVGLTVKLTKNWVETHNPTQGLLYYYIWAKTPNQSKPKNHLF